jgi:FlaA1/EpsC-like NDP-sugar epimerase
MDLVWRAWIIGGKQLKVLNRLRDTQRVALVQLHDLLVGGLAWIFAYLLRFNLEIPENFQHEMWRTLIWIVPLQGVIFRLFGLYRGIWRYASMPDLRRIFLAVLAAAASIVLLIWMLRVDVNVPRSVMIIHPILLLILMGGSRLMYRLWKEQLLYGDFQLQGEPILILGAGDAAISLYKELQRSKAWHVVGFLDDDVNTQGRLLNGKKVFGAIDSVVRWAKEFEVVQAIIAMPNATHQQRKYAIDLCGRNGIKVLTIPSFDDLLSGRVAISQLRKIEIDDLLGRDVVQLDDDGLRDQLTGKVVLVTGAGGSIGSELCRQIARFTPQKLVLFEASEFALYNIEQELNSLFPQLNILYLAGDVRDAMRLEQVFAQCEPSVVFHAAAYKHVPLMERHNAWQAVRNNVYGTWQVAQCAQKHGVGNFVLISTDKAVNPTNVMGTTKRMAEMVCQGVQQASGTRFIIVRFGNVLGSNGSVIPKFREQIAKGGPITVTHPEITRYFMSIPEAAQLVMQAGYMGKGGEIFVLDMGEPVKIVDLAKDLIRLSGLSEDEIKIEFTGLRPGEKLYEELLADDENTLPTPHPKLRIAQARTVSATELEKMYAWISTDATVPDSEVRQAMRQWVPEYTPDER